MRQVAPGDEPSTRQEGLGVRTTLATLVWVGVGVVLLTVVGAWALTDKESSRSPLARSPEEAYGAGGVGEGQEPCATDGTRVSPDNAADRIGSADPGDTLLLTEGTYSELEVPAGRPGRPVTVKPFDCARADVEGEVELASYTTLAGLRIEAPDDAWALHLGSPGATAMTHVTVRHNTIRGGTIEAVRIYDNASSVTVRGNDLDGGRDNHVMKVLSESGEYHPDLITVAGNQFHKDYYDTEDTEDLFQAEGHRRVAVTGNTFGSNPGEDGIDVKTGTRGVTIARNYFEGSHIRGECALIQGKGGRNVVAANYFDALCSLSVGAHLDDSTAVIRDNWLVKSALRVRRSFDVEVRQNVLQRGTLKLGTEEQGDQPRAVVLSHNVLSRTQVLDRATPAGLTYDCTDNVLFATRGDDLRCSGTDRSDPGLSPTIPAQGDPDETAE